MRSFKELECWKTGVVIRKKVRAITLTFPSEEKYRLVDQMIRCSRSVTNNIAEGFGRFHFKENIQFCRHSRGSLTELIDHLTIAVEEGYIDEQKSLEMENYIEECTRILNGYIRYL